MALIRTGISPALLIVDVQVGVMRGAWEAPRVIHNIAVAVDKARKAGAPVKWVEDRLEHLGLVVAHRGCREFGCLTLEARSARL